MDILSDSDVLEVKNLVKTYGNFRAVDGISFLIGKGTCFGLLGPNGAGKTTAIEVIEGILPLDSGDILYKGKKKGKQFHEEVGIQLQNTELPLFLSVKETLWTFRNLYGRTSDFDELIELCQLGDILEKDNRKISGGQKQRLLLAMALANDPDLIFLDEPTTGLDPQARRHLWDIVFQLKEKNKTIILTTHYMEEAQLLCDTIAIMDHGRFVVEGTPEGLLEHYCKGTSIIIPGVTKEDSMDGFRWNWFKLRDNSIEIQTDEINLCLRDLTMRGIDLTGISVRSLNMEDLFLKLTGHELRT